MKDINSVSKRKSNKKGQKEARKKIISKDNSVKAFIKNWFGDVFCCASERS